MFRKFGSNRIKIILKFKFLNTTSEVSTLEKDGLVLPIKSLVVLPVSVLSFAMVNFIK